MEEYHNIVDEGERSFGNLHVHIFIKEEKLILGFFLAILLVFNDVFIDYL